MNKYCPCCDLTKTASEFHKCKNRYDGLHGYCKSCRKINVNEKDVQRKRNWYIKNRTKTLQRVKARYKEKKPQINKYKCDLYRRKPEYWIIRGLVRRTLLGQETERTEKLLGYSSKELRNHLQSLWTPKMSWENYGEWHFDHKKAISDFPTSASVAEINALENLQPLWCTTREINGIIYTGNLNKGKS